MGKFTDGFKEFGRENLTFSLFHPAKSSSFNKPVNYIWKKNLKMKV